MMFNKWRLYHVVIPSLMLSSCVLRAPDNSPVTLWYIDNRFDSELISVTINGSGESVSATGLVDVFAQIEPKGIYAAKSYGSIMDLTTQSQTKIYFIIPCEGYDYDDWCRAIEYAVAHAEVSYDWFVEHKNILRFPEDCIVNPNLGELYDLDEFVEQYGPLNAQGWDEVWHRWQTEKYNQEL